MLIYSLFLLYIFIGNILYSGILSFFFINNFREEIGCVLCLTKVCISKNVMCICKSVKLMAKAYHSQERLALMLYNINYLSYFCYWLKYVKKNKHICLINLWNNDTALIQIVFVEKEWQELKWFKRKERKLLRILVQIVNALSL